MAHSPGSAMAGQPLPPIPGAVLRFKNAGTSNVSEFDEACARDASENTRYCAEMPFNTGNPGSDYIAMAWANRFTRYRVLKRGEDVKTTPDPGSVIDFVRLNAMTIKGGGPDGAVAFKTVETGMNLLIQWASFVYPDFPDKFGSHWKNRSSVLLRNLLHDGVLTKECTGKEKQWITSDVIEKMVRAMLLDGVERGTLCWDALVMKTLSLLLLSALCARVGDVHRARFYQGFECLCWGHIKIRMNTRDGKKLTATITLKYEKGHKDDPQTNRLVEVKEFDDPEYNCSCLIKLLLVHALRTGAVSQTSWQQLRNAIEATPSKRLTWTHPKRPVICAMAGISKKLLLRRPATVTLPRRALDEAGQAIGLLTRVSTHDIRRGAALEISHLPPGTTASGVEAARRALGHSYAAMAAGVTERYIGHSLEDTWEARVKNRESLPQSAERTLDFAPGPYRPKRKHRSDEVVAQCHQMELDPESLRCRKKARAALRKAHYDAWLDAEKTASMTPQTVQSRGNRARRLAEPSTSDSYTDDSDSESEDDDSESDADGAESDDDDSESNADGAESEDDDSENDDDCTESEDDDSESNADGAESEDDDPEGEDETVDPALSSLQSTIFRTAHPSSAPETQLGNISAATPDVKELLSVARHPILDAPPNQFATYLSRVNIYTWEHTMPGLPPCAKRGNSREEPTRRMYRCTVEGCDEEFLNELWRDRHAGTCDAAVRLQYQFPCVTCGRRYETEDQLRTHEKEHGWSPTTCTWPGCADQTVFYTRAEMRSHYSQIHHDLPRDCWVQGCNAKIFATPSNLKAHMRYAHPEVTEEELGRIIPKQKRAAHKKEGFQPQRCSFPRCQHQVVFASRSQYRYHLKVHKVKGDTLDSYIDDDPEPMEPTTPPRTRARQYTAQQCSHPGCRSHETFQHRHKYAAHLETMHGVWRDEDVKLFVM